MNVVFDKHNRKEYFDMKYLPYEMIICILSEIQFFDIYLYNSKNELGALGIIDSIMSVKQERSCLVYNTLDFIANEKTFFFDEILNIYHQRKEFLEQKEVEISKIMENEKIFWGLGGKIEQLMLLLERCGFERFNCHDQNKVYIGDTIENMNLKICSRFF